MPPREVLKERLEERWQTGEHFMPPSQLDAQLADLEIDAAPPQPMRHPLEAPSASGAETQVRRRPEAWQPQKHSNTSAAERNVSTTARFQLEGHG